MGRNQSIVIFSQARSGGVTDDEVAIEKVGSQLDRIAPGSGYFDLKFRSSESRCRVGLLECDRREDRMSRGEFPGDGLTGANDIGWRIVQRDGADDEDNECKSADLISPKLGCRPARKAPMAIRL